MLYGLFQGISYFLQLFYYALLIYCVLSWILPPYHKVMQVLSRVTDPLLRPIRTKMFQIFPQMRFDLSAFVAFLLVRVVQNLLWRLYYALAH